MTLAVPGGAFVQVARGLYSGVMTFVEKGQQIAQVGTALLGSLSAIAAGQLAPAALAVETTLVRVLPVALSFLAQWLGLDGLSGAIRDGLQKVQAPVEKAVGKVLDVVTEKAGAGRVVDKGKAVATGVGNKVAGWLGLRKPFTTPADEQHTLFLQQDGLLTAAGE